MDKKIKSGAVSIKRKPDYDVYAEMARANLENPPEHCRLDPIEDGDEVLGYASEHLRRVDWLMRDLIHEFKEIDGRIQSIKMGYLDEHIRKLRKGLSLHLKAEKQIRILEEEKDEIAYRFTAVQSILTSLVILEFKGSRNRTTILREGGRLVADGFKDDTALASIEIEGEKVVSYGGLIRSLEQ